MLVIYNALQSLAIPLQIEMQGSMMNDWTTTDENEWIEVIYKNSALRKQTTDWTTTDENEWIEVCMYVCIRLPPPQKQVLCF